MNRRKLGCYFLRAVVFIPALVLATSAQVASYLHTVTAFAQNDAWAAGASTSVSAQGIIQAVPLMEHWNGTNWKRYSVPKPADGCSTISGLAGVSLHDIWAVGGAYYNVQNCGDGGPFPAFIEHFDGTAWSMIPNPLSSTSSLLGVAAIASDDVWAVGFNEPSSGFDYTLTEHWDGKQWKIIPSPNIQSQQVYFEAVAAVASNDVWAIGAYLKFPSYTTAPFAEHWDGKEWSIVAVPNTQTGYSWLFSGSAVSSNEVWATGSPDLIFRWDGTNWVPISIPNTGGSLNGVLMFHDGTGWSVGSEGTGCCTAFTLTEHWDGKLWTTVPSPNPTQACSLSAVAATGKDDVWAVGSYDSIAFVSHTLAEHWDGHAWKVVPSP